MRPRPDWLRVVDGGAASPAPGRRSVTPSAGPTSGPTARLPASPVPRLSGRLFGRTGGSNRGAHRCAAQNSLSESTLASKAGQLLRPNTSPWVKLMPAALACMILSGAMLWNLGLVWLERAGPTALAWRPTNVYVTGAVPANAAANRAPESHAGSRTPTAATEAPRRAPSPSSEPVASRRQALPDAQDAQDAQDALSLLAAASLLASLPSAQVSSAPPAEPRSAQAEATPAAREPEPRRSPAARRERTVRVITAQDEVSPVAETEDDSAAEVLAGLEVLPDDVKEAILETVRMEVRASLGKVPHLTAPRAGAGLPIGPDPRSLPGPHVPPGPNAMRVAEECPAATPGGSEHGTVTEDAGGLRVRMRKLSAPATPAG